MDRQTCLWCDKPIAAPEDWHNVPPGGDDGLCWDPEQCYQDADRATVSDKLEKSIARAETAEKRVAELEAAKDVRVETLEALLYRCLDVLQMRSGSVDGLHAWVTRLQAVRAAIATALGKEG